MPPHRRAALTGLLGAGLWISGCTAVLDFDQYVFADGGLEQTPGLPLQPDAAAPAPVPAPVADAGPIDPAGPDAGAPGVQPSPGPLPRPVIVDPPEPLQALAGNPLGGAPRTATCPGGVIQGIVFQFFTSLAGSPDRLTYVWPFCNALIATTPTLTAGTSFDATWLDALPTDPVFAPLRENEGIDSLVCPPNQFLVGIDGTYDENIGPSVGFRSIGIRCAGLGADSSRSEVVHSGVFSAGASVAPASGAFSFGQQCPEGRAAGQLDVRFGSWLDAMGVACSVVRWPFTAGQTCSTGLQCQSGSCVDGLCAP